MIFIQISKNLTVTLYNPTTAYEYQQDSEVATVTSVSDKTVLSISEEETEEVDKGSESDTSEAGSSPFFITRLAKVVEVKEGSPVR